MNDDLKEVRQIMVLFSAPLLFLCAVLIGIHLYESNAFASLLQPRALTEAFDRNRELADSAAGANAANVLSAIEDIYADTNDGETIDLSVDTTSPAESGELPTRGTETDAEDVVELGEEADVPAEAPGAPVGSLLSLGEMDALLSIHNRERARLSIAPLSWSPTLEASAQAWADLLAGDRCVIAHSGGEFGENIYYSKRTGGDQTPRTPQEVMDTFMREAAYYDRSTHTCREGEICGHYTQIMWSGTTELGCARSLCLDAGREEVWVCHYAPAGNVDGEVPF